jgi:DNA-binding helix-hairpin-helix protein with protein kinase domain
MSLQPRKGMTVFAANNRPLVLDQEIGRGGEGSVWAIAGEATVVAKFYHKGLEAEKARKIEAMCRLQSESLLKIAAWPITTLKGKPSGAPDGLLMPRVSGYQEAHLLYTPKSRRTAFPEAQFPFILHATINSARAFATVHQAGQVIGDVNHGNLLISGDARVALIDCDSFEVTDGKAVFPCTVGVPTYTPPELQGQSFQGVRRTKQHDSFGLAVLIFHMLFLGRHPFAGIFRGGTSDKTIEDAIREFRFAYDPDNRRTEMDPPPAIPRLSEFPPELGQLFTRAFGRDGIRGSRPEAHEWLSPLENFSRSLKRCSAQETHHYYHALTSCPWCRVENTFGRAMFGFRLTVFTGTGYDLVAIWAQIESVRTHEPNLTPPSIETYLHHCTPDPTIPDLKKRRRVKRALGIASILVAVIIVAPGFLTALPSTFILLAGIVATLKLWHTGDKCTQGITGAHTAASRAFKTGMNRWASLERVPTAFEQTKQRLKAEKDSLAALPGIRIQRLAELNANLRQKQLTRYLEHHRIEDASIPGIGPGRKTLLRCYNVEDASDVTASRLNIKGFGPALKASLLAWRKMVEQGFRFNPNEGVAAADIRALDQELSQRRAALMQSLSTGSQQLKQALLPWQLERESVRTNLGEWARQLAQCEVNIRALGRI